MAMRGGDGRGSTGTQLRALLAVAGVWLALLPALAHASVEISSIAGAPSSGFTPNARLVASKSLTTDTSVKRAVNKDDCEAIFAAKKPIVRITWSFIADNVITIPTSYGVKIAPPGKSCSATSMTESGNDGCSVLISDKATNPLSALGLTIDIDLRDLFAGVVCSNETEVEARVYFVIGGTGTTAGQQFSGATLNITLDTKPPAVPTIDSVAAGAKNLTVAWTLSDAANTPYARVYWSKVAFPASAPTTATSKSDKLTATTYQITELENGTTYYVAVTAIDANENESKAAAVREGVPIEIQDFWQYYQASGGTEEGGYYGCSAAPASGGPSPWTGLLLLGAASLLVSLRRRRSGGRGVGIGAFMLPLAVLAGGALAPAPAAADSPRTSSLDLRLGFYAPDIDSEFVSTNGQQPYAKAFTDTSLQKSIGFEQILLDGFGDLSIGGSVGWWSIEGKGRKLDGTKSQDKTTLTVVPVTVNLGLRLTVLAFRYGFPLVPYARGGLAYAFWWAKDGNDEVSTWIGVDNKVRTAEGGIAGLHGTIGVRLLLDTFEPRAARGFDLESGVNHSYLFAEYQRLSLNNFGDSRTMDLSDSVLMFGLAFDL